LPDLTAGAKRAKSSIPKQFAHFGYVSWKVRATAADTRLELGRIQGEHTGRAPPLNQFLIEGADRHLANYIVGLCLIGKIDDPAGALEGKHRLSGRMAVGLGG
jgi:hypothetical protein